MVVASGKQHPNIVRDGEKAMNDVIIIGAGPAGLSASISCARFGLNVLVIDEFMKPGGRLLGQLHQEPSGEWWNGIEESKRLHDEAKSLSVHIRCGISVYNLDKDESCWFVHTNIGTLEAPFVLLATGAAEYSIPFPLDTSVSHVNRGSPSNDKCSSRSSWGKRNHYWC